MTLDNPNDFYIDGAFTPAGCSSRNHEFIEISLTVSPVPEIFRQLANDASYGIDVVYYRGMVGCNITYGANREHDILANDEAWIEFDLHRYFNPTYDVAACALAGSKLARLLQPRSDEDIDMFDNLLKNGERTPMTDSQARGIFTRLLQGMTLS